MVSAESKKGGGIAATAEYCTNGEQCQVSSVPCSRDGSLCRRLHTVKMKKMTMTSFATQEERRAQAQKCRETVKLGPNATQNEFQVSAI